MQPGQINSNIGMHHPNTNNQLIIQPRAGTSMQVCSFLLCGSIEKMKHTKF